MLSASLALIGAASMLALWYPTNANLLVIATTLMVVVTAGTVSRLYRVHSWVDLFHPLLFPSVYAAVTFLLPTWLLLIRPTSVGLPAYAPIAVDAAALMAAAAVSFTLGCATSWLLPFRSEPSDRRVSSGKLRKVGWVLLAIPLASAFRDLSNKVVFTRHLQQTTFDLSQHVEALAAMSAPAAVLLLLAAQRLTGRRKLLQPADWLAVAALLMALGMNGRRASALTVLLMILYAWSQRMRRGALTIVGIVTITALAYAVVAYRSSVLGDHNGNFLYATVLDISPALFTTGATAAVIPSVTPYLDGGTYLGGLLRQIPGPLATFLFGPPDDTGAFVFRRIIGYDNPDGGVGFSVPAEGYMNFGILGLIASCSILGVALAWGYRRGGDGSRPVHLLYPLLIGTLPYGLRADFLGTLKAVLYPMLMISVAYLAARVSSGPQKLSLKHGLQRRHGPQSRDGLQGPQRRPAVRASRWRTGSRPDPSPHARVEGAGV